MSDRAELYGADLDLYYRAVEADGFSLWAGIGGTFTPYQDAGKVSFHEKDASDPYTTIELGGKGECDVGYGEFRMMLVPEYEVVFLATELRYSCVNSSTVRTLGAHGGELSPFVPDSIAVRVREKFKEKYL